MRRCFLLSFFAPLAGIRPTIVKRKLKIGTEERIMSKKESKEQHEKGKGKREQKEQVVSISLANS
jgi:hypothetical protein